MTVPVMRTCTRCDVAYPAGTYRQHADRHVPLREPTAGSRHPERDAVIAAEVAAGVRTLADIGSDYGMTWERVRQIAAREGVKRNGVKVPARPRLGPRTRCLTCRALVLAGAMREHRLAAGHTTRNNARLTGAHLELIREFYGRGLGYLAIGDTLGISFMAVKYRIEQMGLRHHRAGEYPRDGSGHSLRTELAARLREMAA